ncbi:hypothetical protein [Paludibacterium paludis]|uniref:Uncharacterized protein n=1 Tax=Paludibacterium paludis TaxID=1225769 RepID=A0A918P377_9NEIS|nr:hypothetical protein [Paludibacterium paludis]GGY17500.1 hypothetical protein GCM10011289_21190 [Paludibacterium paludis]
MSSAFYLLRSGCFGVNGGTRRNRTVAARIPSARVLRLSAGRRTPLPSPEPVRSMGTFVISTFSVAAAEERE